MSPILMRFDILCIRDETICFQRYTAQTHHCNPLNNEQIPTYAIHKFYFPTVITQNKQKVVTKAFFNQTLFVHISEKTTGKSSNMLAQLKLQTAFILLEKKRNRELLLRSDANEGEFGEAISL